MIVHGIAVEGKSSIEFVYNGDGVIINILHEDLEDGDNTMVDTGELIKVLSLIKKEHKEFKDNLVSYKDKVESIATLLKGYNFIVDGGSIDTDVAYDAFTTNLLILAEEWNN